MLEPARNNPICAKLNFTAKPRRLNFPHPRSAEPCPEDAAPTPPFMKFQVNSTDMNMAECVEKSPQSAAKPKGRMYESERGPFAGRSHTK